MYGLDIGGTKTEFAVFDNSFNLSRGHRVATPTRDYGQFIGFIHELISVADRKYGPAEFIGIGLPGFRDHCGRSFSVNVPCINERNVEEELERVLHRPVAITNDGRALVLSEVNGGSGHGKDPAVGVILGTGAFGSHFIGGAVRGGKDGIAGEWGHSSIAATVRERHNLPLYSCGCGKRGCVETYVSGRGLSRLHSHVAGVELPSERVIAGMRAGDTHCMQTFDIWLDCVASCFAQLVLQINPEIIVVGGGLSRTDELYSRLPALLPQYLLAGIPLPEIAPAKFGDASGVRGAAIYAVQQLGAESDSLLKPESR